MGRLLTDDTIARNVEEITEDAGGFVRSITRLQTIVGLRTEYNFLASTFKNYLSIQLMPRPDKFYLIELVEDPRGYRDARPSPITNNSSQLGTETETKVTLTEQLRFTLQFGKRIGCRPRGDRRPVRHQGVDRRRRRRPLPLRRSAAAVGRRVRRARSTGTRASRPRCRTRSGSGTCSWSPAPTTWQTTKRRRPAARCSTGSLGLQLVFNDEDLRSLLLFGGGAAAGAGIASDRRNSPNLPPT